MFLITLKVLHLKIAACDAGQNCTPLDSYRVHKLGNLKRCHFETILPEISFFFISSKCAPQTAQ